MVEHTNARESRDVRIAPIGLVGILQTPKNAYALVAFAHGSSSSRLSPRNMVVARALNDRGIVTLLFDVLTPAEEADRANVFNIPLLADRLVDAAGSTAKHQLQSFRLGCLAPVPERRRLLSRRQSFRAVSVQWFRAADVPTSRVMRSTQCTLQRF